MRKNNRSMPNWQETWHLSLHNQSYEIAVTYKNMKSVRLRVVRGGQIRLSAPFGISRTWLERFLREREDWIMENVRKMQEKSEEEAGKEEWPPFTEDQRRQVLQYLQPMVDAWYPVVQAYGAARPRVTIRRMKTRYGSCSVNSSRITLNDILMFAPRECAEYVVLHELAHFLHPNHGKAFYQFIERYMPDWKEREKVLHKIRI